MRRNKIIVLLASIMVCIMLVSGCASDQSETAAAYVQATLDLTFQGETEGAKQFIGASDEQLEQVYENGISAFVSSYLTSGMDTGELFTGTYGYIMKEIFAVSKYQIVSTEKVDRNTYEVMVTYQPVDVFLKFIPQLQVEAEQIEKDAANGKYEGTKEEQQYNMLYDYLNHSYDYLESAYLDMEYLDEQMHKFTVTVKSGRTPEMVEDEINSFIESILALDKV